MVHRHPLLYRILALVCFCVFLALVFMGVVPAWSSETRNALLVISAFPLIIFFIYVHMGNHEDQAGF
jgi:hypothetical protein